MHLAGVLYLEITVIILIIIHVKLLVMCIPFSTELTFYSFMVSHEARFISSNYITLGKFFNALGLSFHICKI